MDISVIPGSDYNKELFEKLKNNRYNTDLMKYDNPLNTTEMRFDCKGFVFSPDEALNMIESLLDPNISTTTMSIDVYNNKADNTVTFTFYDKTKSPFNDRYIYKWFPITILTDDFEAFRERGLIRGIEKVSPYEKSLGAISPDILNRLTDPINGFCKYKITYIANSDKTYKEIAPYLYAG